MAGTQVTCTDIETGDTRSETIENDYVLVTDGRVYLDSTRRYANGTTVLTVKTNWDRMPS